MARVLKSINYWSFPGGLEGTFPVAECLEAAKRHGFEAVELCIGRDGALGVGASEVECREIRREAEALGLVLPSVASGLYWGRALGDDDAAARRGALEDLQAMLRISSWLGAQTLLTIPGAVDVFFDLARPVMAYDSVLARAREGLQAALKTAAECGVRMGIENVWSKFLLSPTEMAGFIDSFGSPWIGAYVDVANVLPYGYPEQWLRVLGKRVVGIHFKDFRRAVGTIEGFVDLLEGDVDWPAVVGAIGEIGYEGPVVGEMIPLYRHFPYVRVGNTSRAMDAILGRG